MPLPNLVVRFLGSFPSICIYTLLNSIHNVTAAEVAEDSSLLAVGFSDSAVKVWSLVSQKLILMRSRHQLSDIDREAVRLWSLHTWTCVVCFKGHLFPVWSVQFSLHGYYFATASHDKTARLWATDAHQLLRIFAAHYSDIDVVQFHPNENYVATGLSDRTVRLWDCVTGHKAPIYSLAFSVEDCFLATAGPNTRVLIWDLAHGHLVAALSSHTAVKHYLFSSWDVNILVSGSLDFILKLWDFTKLAEEMNLEDVNVSHNLEVT